MENQGEIYCKDCIGLAVKPEGFDAKIQLGRTWQMNAIKSMTEIKLFILLHKVTGGRFFYDAEVGSMLREDLKRILLRDSTDTEFINYLNRRGIVVVECCYCPIQRFCLYQIPYERMPEAITMCFRRHNMQLLMLNKEAPIITIFNIPRFIENGVPEIQHRIIKNFGFYKMERANKRFVKLVDSITGI